MYSVRNPLMRAHNRHKTHGSKQDIFIKYKKDTQVRKEIMKLEVIIAIKLPGGSAEVVCVS